MSAIPAAKAALADLLDTLEDVTVTVGVPKEISDAPANVYLLGAENITRSRPGLGIVQEAFDVRLVVEVHQLEKTGSRQGVEGDLWAIVEQVEDLLAADSRFAPAVIDSHFSPSEEDSGFVRGVWLARLRAVVHVEAEIG